MRVIGLSSAFVLCLPFAWIVFAATSCSTANVGGTAASFTTQNFVGRFAAGAAGEQGPLIAFLVVPKSDSTLDVRAYTCDGKPEGEVVWVRGPATSDSRDASKIASLSSFSFDLTSAAGYTLKGTITAGGVEGQMTAGPGLPQEGVARSFRTTLAGPGSGVYDLTVTAEGDVSGKSLTGDELQLSKSEAVILSVGDGQPFVGTLTTADGTVSDFIQMDLSTLNAEDLEGKGFPAEFSNSPQGVEPGTFRAIVVQEGDVFTSYGRLLLPGTGVNGLPPRFGLARVSLSCAVCKARL